jgi:hypothetical protein
MRRHPLEAALGLLLLATLPSASAASGGEPGMELKKAVDAARASAGCKGLVTPALRASLPVPVAGPGGLRYRVFFYDDTPGAQGPRALVEFRPPATVLSCRDAETLRSGTGDALGDAPAALVYPEREFQLARDKVLPLVRYLSEAFADGRKDEVVDDAAWELKARFEQFTEPGLTSAYRKMSPAFWSWLDERVAVSRKGVPESVALETAAAGDPCDAVAGPGNAARSYPLPVRGTTGARTTIPSTGHMCSRPGTSSNTSSTARAPPAVCRCHSRREQGASRSAPFIPRT